MLNYIIVGSVAVCLVLFFIKLVKKSNLKWQKEHEKQLNRRINVGKTVLKLFTEDSVYEVKFIGNYTRHFDNYRGHQYIKETSVQCMEKWIKKAPGFTRLILTTI